MSDSLERLHQFNLRISEFTWKAETQGDVQTARAGIVPTIWLALRLRFGIRAVPTH